MQWLKVLLTHFFMAFFILAASTAALFGKSRYTIQGNTLIFDMAIEEPGHEFDGNLDEYDAKEILAYLFENPEISVLRVTGPGGSMRAARTITDYLVLHKINTEALGICNSACSYIFLGGTIRTLFPDAKLGFHRPWANKARLRKEYLDSRPLYDWHDEFDYAATLFDSSMIDLLNYIKFMLSRGVDIEFILNAFSTDSFHMWYPSKEQLVVAGIVTQ